MALNSVTLTGSVPGGSGAEATFTQSAWLTDSTDNELIPPVQKSVTLDRNGKFSVSLLATDNGALLPSGWTWSVVISGINVASLGFSFFLPFSGGATQDIADLTPVQPTPPVGPSGGVTVMAPKPIGATAQDTPALEAVIATLENALALGPATLQLQDGTYQVDSNALVIRSVANFAIKSAGATTITQAPNTASKPNNTTGNLLTIADCTDFRVSDITFDGLRDTVAPLTPLSASASSGQPSVTVAAGQGAHYVVGQGLALFGGLGSGEQAQFDGWGGGGGAQPLIIQSITAGGGSGGGDLITFTTNLGHTYASISSTPISDGFGPYAYAGAYLTPYQCGHNNTVASRTLGGEDQQNGLHLISCQRFTVDRVTGRNVWESGIKLGTGFASTSLTDGCSFGTVTDCTGYHGYDQGVSVWMSQNITVKGCVLNATGWAGISLTGSDYCSVTANQVSSNVYRVPVSLTQGHGIAIEGGRGNLVKGNSIINPYNTGINCHQSPLAWGLSATYPSLGTFIEEGTAAGTSIQVSASAAFTVGAPYSILDGAKTEAVTVASIVDGTHITLADSLRFSHASGAFFWNRVAEDNIIEGNRVSVPQTGPGIGGAVQVRSAIKGNSVSGCTVQAVTVGFTISGLPSGTSLAGNGSSIEGNVAARISGTVILAAGSSDLVITGNIISGSAATFVQGIDVSGCTDTVISDNHVSDIAGARGIFGNTGGLAANACARVSVLGNTVRRCNGEGILFFSGDSLTITGNTVSSCGGDAGINLRGCTNSVVTGNITNSNQLAGIALEDNSGVFSLSNRVTGNTARDDGTGVNVQTGAGWTQQHGIRETGSSNNNVYTGNECDANAIDQLVTVGAASYAYANVLSGAPAGALPPVLLPAVSNNPGPSINQLLAWSWDINDNGSNAGTLATGGTLYLIQFVLFQATTLSKLWWWQTAAAITPTVGESQVGVYSSAGLLVASATPAATATALTGPSAASASLSSTYAAPAGTYWQGMVFQAATEPTLLHNGTNNGAMANVGIAAAANYRVCVNGTGITTALPASITPSANSQAGSNCYWVAQS